MAADCRSTPIVRRIGNFFHHTIRGVVAYYIELFRDEGAGPRRHWHLLQHSLAALQEEGAVASELLVPSAGLEAHFHLSAL